MQVVSGGIIEVDATGREIGRYTPDEWRSKMVDARLTAIESRLVHIEKMLQHLCPDKSDDI